MRTRPMVLWLILTVLGVAALVPATGFGQTAVPTPVPTRVATSTMPPTPFVTQTPRPTVPPTPAPTSTAVPTAVPTMTPTPAPLSITAPVTAPTPTPTEVPLYPAGASPVAPEQRFDHLTVDRTSPRFPVWGSAFAFLPAPAPGEVSIVASGVQAGGNAIALVIQNGTEVPVANVAVSVEARDGSGNLLAVGASGPSELHPGLLEPGALGLVSVRLNGAAVPLDAVLAFSLTHDANVDRFAGWTGIELTEFAVTPSDFIGTLTNPSPYPMSDVRLSIACFSATGQLYAIDTAFVNQGAIGPGASAGFYSIGGMRTTNCAFVLVVGEGYAAAPPTA